MATIWVPSQRRNHFRSSGLCTNQTGWLWCSKADCPKLGRKKSYDLILKETQENEEDGELEHLIKEGVAPEADIDEEK